MRGVGLAVVPGQGIAGLPGPAGDGVVAYLAAGDRKMGDGHGEAPGTVLPVTPWSAGPAAVATSCPVLAAPFTACGIPDCAVGGVSCGGLAGGAGYEPGEYCRDSDQGMTGVAGDGESISCEDNDGLRWEPTG